MLSGLCLLCNECNGSGCCATAPALAPSRQCPVCRVLLQALLAKLAADSRANGAALLLQINCRALWAWQAGWQVMLHNSPSNKEHPCFPVRHHLLIPLPHEQQRLWRLVQMLQTCASCMSTA